MIQVIRDEEKKEFEDIMDEFATVICRESIKGLKDLHIPDVNREHSIALGKAVGQIYLDEVIEMTKDVPQDKFIRWFAEVTGHWLVGVMNNHPVYREKILFKANIKE